MTIIASGIVSRIERRWVSRVAQRLFDLLLLVDVERYSAEVMRLAVRRPDQPAAQPYPAVLALDGHRQGDIEHAAGVNRVPDRALGRFAVFRLKQGKEKVVVDRLFARNAEKASCIVRPDQLVRQQIEIPGSDAGALDPEPEPLVADGFIRWGRGEVDHAGSLLRVFRFDRWRRERRRGRPRRPTWGNYCLKDSQSSSLKAVGGGTGLLPEPRISGDPCQNKRPLIYLISRLDVRR